MLNKQIIANFASSIKDLCFPPACLLCKKPLNRSSVFLCSACIGGISFCLPPYCSKCGLVFVSRNGESHLCSLCRREEYFFHKARALFVYSRHCSPLIHDLKYGGSTTGLKTLARLKAQKGAGLDLSPPSLILPVPLHPKRLRQRGFNQAMLLAKAFFPEEKNKVDPFILRRVKDTRPQTSLSGRERRQNLRGAFKVVKKEKVAGRSILLVDDVFTTGTTLNECARLLAAAGAKRVEVFTLARVRD